jgi:N-acetylneuraminate synthase
MKRTKQVYVIAEIGINHNGSMNLARALIDKAAEAGCNAVKFQKRDIDTTYTKEELETPRQSPWGTTTRQQKEGLEFNADQYRELYTYTKNLGLDFGVSCWDVPSVELIEKAINVDFHKVASASITDKALIESIKATGKPVILSTGMSDGAQVWKAVDAIGVKRLERGGILACTSTYPTKPEEVNLNYISTLQDNYLPVPVGFSNHYNGHDACIGAVALGASIIEFHITCDRTMYGSDQAASIENVKELVSGIRNMELMLGTGEKVVFPSEVPIAKKLRKVNTL